MPRLLLPALLACSLHTSAQFGTLDPSFAGDGIARTAIELPSVGYAIAVQPNGNILVAGGADSTGALVRYLPDGSLDAAFGAGGTARLHIQHWNVIRAIGLQPNGRIIVTGQGKLIGTTTSEAFVTGRYNTNGTIDVSFGNNGNGVLSSYLSNQTGTLMDLHVLPNGRILVAGWTFAGISSGSWIERLTGNGQYDTSFGDNGQSFFATFLTIGYNRTDATCITTQADGGILVGGTLWSNTLGDRFVIRLAADGTRDETFAGDFALLDAGPNGTEAASDILVQADGKILLVGSAANGATSGRYCITRLNADGTLDDTYGSNGNALGPDQGGAVATGAGCLQADGKLVFVCTTSAGGTTSSSVWRLGTDGDPDPTFGTNGEVEQPCGNGTSALFGAAMQSDGKILITGQGPDGQAITTARLGSGQPLGVEEAMEHLPLEVFPNPANGPFMIRAAVALDRVEVVDALGRTVHAERNVSGDHLIDLPAMAPGPYALRAQVGGKTVILPMIQCGP